MSEALLEFLKINWWGFWCVVGISLFIIGSVIYIEVTAESSAKRLRAEGKGCPK